MLWRPSLRARLILILFVTFCAGLLGAGAFFYWEGGAIGAGLRERSLQEQARQLLDGLSSGSSGQTAAAALRSVDPIYARPGAAYGYTLFDRDGRVRAVSESRRGSGPLPFTQLPGFGEQFGPVFFVGPSRIAAMTVRTPDNRFFLIVSRDDPDPRTLAESLIEQDARPLFILAPFVLLAFALIVLVINRTLRPLERASSEAARIGPASSVARVSPAGLPSEIIPLVKAFNGALDRLHKAYHFEKQLTADAAHELRTPLAVLRMRLERARLSTETQLDWEAVSRDFAQIDRLTAQLLDLARKEQVGTPERKSEVNMSRVAREAAALLLPMVERADRSLTVVAPEPVVIAHGVEDDLRDMLRNLIENALIHGKGAITVTVERVGRRDRDYATITVEDEGGGVPESIRELVFERFRKGDASTRGAGLGLAIVRHVAGKHGGTAEFQAGPQSCVRITLPLVGPE